MNRTQGLSLVLLMLVGLSVSSQTQLILRDDEGPVPGVAIWSEASGELLGATDADGVWTHEGPCNGKLSIRTSALGYLPESHVIPCGETRVGQIQHDVIFLRGATVVGGLAPMSIRESPIRTQVLSGKSLRSIPADDAIEALDFTNGLRETVACGVCGTQDIHINGLEGVYTLVLLDGVPLLGGLASAYALDGLPLSMVQQVEVIQGPASARFGSQAVGGVINILLEPVENSRNSFSLRQDTHGRLLSSATWGNRSRNWQLGADGQRFVRRIDDNADGITDAPTIERLVLTARHARTKNDRKTTVLLRGLAERRFGGVLDFTEADRGGDLRYGERIDLLRGEVVFGQNQHLTKPFRLVGGSALHNQKSTYGTAEFNATEWISNVDLLWKGLSFGQKQFLRGGLSAMWDVYTDETPVSSDMNWVLPAAFLEESGQIQNLSWILGIRAEKPVDLTSSGLPTDLILAPRVNLKWSIRPNLDTRLNVGRGYRRIHLFTEEHAALDGSRNILIEGSLTPELSWNGNWSFGTSVGNNRWYADGSVLAFGTFFSNRLFADYNAQPNAIVYRNIDGMGFSRGLAADINGRNYTGMTWSLGGTWMRAEILEGESLREIEFAPRWTSNVSCGWEGDRWQWDFQGQTVGPMLLPEVEGFPSHSTPYVLCHVSGGRKFGRGTFRFGIKNLTNTSQPTPIIGAESPFDESFDASRVYGPIEGRRMFVGWSMNLGRD